ncbi:MAG: glycerol-3-phosphate 1-O-acyltransferase PlsY [Bacillota bacterium]|jgi:glycerol-3-phosphate acyltransferase PlsY|nr:glycerol-3-phosphate 1-O-acyltransferase PlsY [Bacillota bacterium]
MDSIYFYIAILFGYLLGSIPWALVIGKVFYKTDIRTKGSGNLGGSNAGRVLGKKAGVAVTIMDAIKAVIVVVVCHFFIPEATIFAGLACCFGHCFPIFANFKGGKAVATTMGYFLAVSIFVTGHFFYQFILILIIFFVLLYITKIVSISSMSAILAAVVISFILKNDIEITLSFLALWIFVVYRHKDNIKRLLNGTEKKITWM